MVKGLNYAGFWIRFAAAIVDGIILYAFGLIPVVGTIISLVYRPYFEGYKGATVGKMAMGLLVVNPDGTYPIGLKKAVIRTLGGILSALLLGLGYLMIAFDSKKRGLHDRIASTYVIHGKEVEKKKRKKIEDEILDEAYEEFKNEKS